MIRQSCRLKALLGCFILTACSTQAPLEAKQQASQNLDSLPDPDIEPLSARFDHVDAVAISEEVYFERVRQRNFEAASVESKEAQLELAAKANEPDALGLVGSEENNVALDGRRIIVLHNPKRTPTNKLQATSFSVVSGRFWGSVAKGVVGLKLHYASTTPPWCPQRMRGCKPMLQTDLRPLVFSNDEPGGLGLNDDVRIDAESPLLPSNQLGRSQELWVLPNTDIAADIWPEGAVFTGHRYACALPLKASEALECDVANPAAEPLPVVQAERVELSERIVMVFESDFESALVSGAFDNLTPDPALIQTAVEIGTALNHPQSRGILAKARDADSIEADVLVVARNPTVVENVMGGMTFFIVPGPLALNKLSRGTVGTRLTLEGIGPQFFSGGVCGPEFFPNLTLEQPKPALTANQGGYGTDRHLMGLPRTTIRFPTQYGGRPSIQTLACSHYEPPRPRPPPAPLRFKYEECNGVDDDDDKLIDEDDVCTVKTCSTCAPVSDCGHRRCVSAPDGCGGLITCPCP